MTNKSISIIIVSYHTGEVLFDCLQAALSDLDISQIIIVDNGNNPAIVERIKKTASINPKLHYIDAGMNLGFAKACNLGAAKTDCETLVFLNPDAIIQTGAINELSSLLDSEPKIIGGLIIDENGNEQRGARRGNMNIITALITFSGLGRHGSKAGVWRDFNWWREPMPKEPVTVGTISGAFFAIKALDFSKLGGFDEGYFLHVEDIDLCNRMRSMGGKIIFNPKAKAIHIGATSEAPKAVVTWHKFRGFMRYFWNTHKVLGKIVTVLIAPILFAAIFTRDLLKRK